MRDQKCYRVLVVDSNMTRWTPVITARDVTDITAKVENIYPGGAVLDSYVIHEKHSQWDIVFPEAPVVSAISGGASLVERRKGV